MCLPNKLKCDLVNVILGGKHWHKPGSAVCNCEWTLKTGLKAGVFSMLCKRRVLVMGILKTSYVNWTLLMVPFQHLSPFMRMLPEYRLAGTTACWHCSRGHIKLVLLTSFSYYPTLQPLWKSDHKKTEIFSCTSGILLLLASTHVAMQDCNLNICCRLECSWSHSSLQQILKCIVQWGSWKQTCCSVLLLFGWVVFGLKQFFFWLKHICSMRQPPI